MIDTTNAGYTPRALDYVRRFNAAEVTVSKLREDQRASRAFAAELCTDAELENARLFDALADETGIEIDAALADAKSSIDCLVAMPTGEKHLMSAVAAADTGAADAARERALAVQVYIAECQVHAAETYSRTAIRAVADSAAAAALARACED